MTLVVVVDVPNSRRAEDGFLNLSIKRCFVDNLELGFARVRLLPQIFLSPICCQRESKI
jgi:hypothetical protein